MFVNNAFHGVTVECNEYLILTLTETPTRIFFYISLENVSIYTKFLGYVCEELGIPSKSKLNIDCYCSLGNISSNVYLLPLNPVFANM